MAILLNGRLLAVRSLMQGAGPRLRLRVRSASPDARSGRRLAPCLAWRASNRPRGLPRDVHDFVVQVEAPAGPEALAAAVTAGGFGLLEMTETGTDLEALFLDLTGRAAA